ncbi:MAG TPA: hemerythrin domain-containing protein [Deltaproteobacteria bacterium]|nr:hemerythrin domain-containing protein [Deltaproteobacteria bacterium]
MEIRSDFGRRAFLRRGGLLLAVSLAGCAHPMKPAKDEGKEGTGISPPEDLMREHGVLRRILLIYEESIRRIDTDEALPLDSVADASGIIHDFVENYHEKLEEDFLFPRFKKAGTLTDLVNVLTKQHNAGKRLTKTTLSASEKKGPLSPEDRSRLKESMHRFIRMYRPHASREDTVLFPEFRKIVPPREFEELGEEFEEREDKAFGKDGFFKVVGRVEMIEKRLGIFDLQEFTPVSVL